MTGSTTTTTQPQSVPTGVPTGAVHVPMGGDKEDTMSSSQGPSAQGCCPACLVVAAVSCGVLFSLAWGAVFGVVWYFAFFVAYRYLSIFGLLVAIGCIAIYVKCNWRKPADKQKGLLVSGGLLAFSLVLAGVLGVLIQVNTDNTTLAWYISTLVVIWAGFLAALCGTARAIVVCVASRVPPSCPPLTVVVATPANTGSPQKQHACPQYHAMEPIKQLPQPMQSERTMSAMRTSLIQH